MCWTVELWYFFWYFWYFVVYPPPQWQWVSSEIWVS